MELGENGAEARHLCESTCAQLALMVLMVLTGAGTSPSPVPHALAVPSQPAAARAAAGCSPGQLQLLPAAVPKRIGAGHPRRTRSPTSACSPASSQPPRGLCATLCSWRAPTPGPPPPPPPHTPPPHTHLVAHVPAAVIPLHHHHRLHQVEHVVSGHVAQSISQAGEGAGLAMRPAARRRPRYCVTRVTVQAHGTIELKEGGPELSIEAAALCGIRAVGITEVARTGEEMWMPACRVLSRLLTGIHHPLASLQLAQQSSPP